MVGANRDRVALLSSASPSANPASKGRGRTAVMPEHASRFIGLYDQQNENRIPDWGGDELFTRMPSRPAVDDAPAPRFQPKLELVDAPEERRRTPPGEEWRGPRDRRRGGSAAEAMLRARRAPRPLGDRARPAGRRARVGRRRRPRRPARAVCGRRHRRARAGRGRATTRPPARVRRGSAAARAWEQAETSPAWEHALEPPPERAANGRRTTVITGRPERARGPSRSRGPSAAARGGRRRSGSAPARSGSSPGRSCSACC